MRYICKNCGREVESKIIGKIKCKKCKSVMGHAVGIGSEGALAFAIGDKVYFKTKD